MGKLQKIWKAAKSQIKKVDLKKLFKKNLSATIDKAEKGYKEAEKEAQELLKKDKLTPKEVAACTKKMRAATTPAYEILGDYKILAKEAGAEYKKAHGKEKDPEKKEDLKYMAEECLILYLALDKIVEELSPDMEEILLKLQAKS